MASSETTVKLPSIESLKVTTKEGVAEGNQDKPENQRLDQAESFISRLKLGSLQRQKRPGDVWEAGVTRQPRPLGLVPDRQKRFDALRELSRFLPPISAYTRRIRVPRVNNSTGDHKATDEPPVKPSDDSRKTEEVISATVKTSTGHQGQEVEKYHSQAHFAEAPPPSNLLGTDNPLIPFRYSYGNQLADEVDQDYLDTLAKCDLEKYYAVPQTLPAPRSQTIAHPGIDEGWSGHLQLFRGGKKSGKLGRSRSSSSGPQFLTFSEQSHLWNRSFTDDRRLPLDCGLCERCRERGGRCARCKALRVGGGYIILDGESLPDDELRKRFGRRNYRLGSGHVRDGSNKRGGRRGDLDSMSGLGGSGAGDASEGGDGHERGVVSGGGRWSELDGDGGGLSGRGSVRDGRLSSRSGRDQLGMESGGNEGGGQRRGGHGQLQGDGSNGTSGDGYGTDRGDREGGGRRGRDGSGTGEGRDGGEGDESGRVSSRAVSRMSSSRPGSTLGTRPASSFKRRGLDRRDRDKKNIDLEGGRGRGKRKGDGKGGSGSEDSDNDEKRGRRRKKKTGTEEDDDMSDNGNDREKSNYKFKSSRDEEDVRPTSGYHGNLMRFKRKKDNVKAIHATLKELQGIDPLDYLAKYCIIDQNKLPHYQHCFDNVDRDEDDEIDINELDFALKAVNYELITDAEMNYVHSVLELAGRYRLNFRLFSLIAALSEKVVALEDMVKRLINKMDFEALEVKMKKCKELFYLLADAESDQEHDGGVVTTSSLAVELQAGGLTHKHVEFVVDRLNHEGKGLVEFLDYLTYVPLFVEIHDSISGNPLDFSRTK